MAVGESSPALRLCNGSEAGSYLRLIDSCITQLKTQGPSRTCIESKEEDSEGPPGRCFQPWGGLAGGGLVFKAHRLCVYLLGSDEPEVVVLHVVAALRRQIPGLVSRV